MQMRSKSPIQAGDKARVTIGVDVAGVGEDGTACVTYPWGEHRMMAHFLVEQLERLEVTKTPSLTPDPNEPIPTD